MGRSRHTAITGSHTTDYNLKTEVTIFSLMFKQSTFKNLSAKRFTVCPQLFYFYFFNKKQNLNHVNEVFDDLSLSALLHKMWKGRVGKWKSCALIINAKTAHWSLQEVEVNIWLTLHYTGVAAQWWYNMHLLLGLAKQMLFC